MTIIFCEVLFIAIFLQRMWVTTPVNKRDVISTVGRELMHWYTTANAHRSCITALHGGIA